MSIWKSLFSKSSDIEEKERIEEDNRDLIKMGTNLLIDHLINYRNELTTKNILYYDRVVMLLIKAIDEMFDRYTAEHILEEIDHDPLYKFPNQFDKQLPNYIESQIRDCIDELYKNPYRMIYNFAKFLITADKLLLYQNGDTESVYSVQDGKDSIKLFIIMDDFNIGYYFTNDLTMLKKKNLLDEYMNDDIQERIVSYVEVKRNAGSMSTSSFAFELDGHETPNGSIDKVLFFIILQNTIRTIANTFNTILNRVIPVYTAHEVDNFDLMEYLNGFRI